jgi:predicted component of type VI protein secretion system
MARLTVKFGTKIERVVELDAAELVIGRGSEAHLNIDDPIVSRLHCRVVSRDGAFVVEDLDSKSGTVVNGKKVKTRTLGDGDQIGFGRYVVVFERGATAAPARTAAPPVKAAAAKAAHAEASDFWAAAAADSSSGQASAPPPAPKAGAAAKAQATPPTPAQRGGAVVESAAELAAGGGGGAGGLSDAQGTVAATPADMERVLKSLETQQKPHLSVIHDGKRQFLALDGDSFSAGWKDGMQVRLPGSRWFGKCAFVVKKAGKGWEVVAGSVSNSEYLDGKKIRGSLRLEDGNTIEAGGIKFRFGKGTVA